MQASQAAARAQILTVPSVNSHVSAKRKVFVATLAKTEVGIEAEAAKMVKDTPVGMSLKDLLRSDSTHFSRDKVILDIPRMHPAQGAALALVAASVVSRTEQYRLNAERISVIRQLSGLGYKVLVPDYGLSNSIVMGRIKGHSRVFKARPVVIATNGHTKEYSSSIMWARDMWQKFEGRRVIRGGENANTAGEGGMVVPINERTAVVSESLRQNPTIAGLAGRGHRFYFMKNGLQFHANLSRVFSMEIYGTMDHVDLFVGVAGGVMLVEGSYFTGQNKTVLRQATRENGLRMLFVPPGEEIMYPANFLVLEQNRILMNRNAERTIALMRGNGVEVIPTDVAIKANLRAGGSIHCFVNEL